MRYFFLICCMCCSVLMVAPEVRALSEVTEESAVVAPVELEYPEMITRKDTFSDGSATLSTPLAVYTNDKGKVVYLVGAVHLGEKEYYGELNKRFATYDVVLFEMIGGEDLQRLLHLVKRNHGGVITDDEKKELTELVDRLNKESEGENKLRKIFPEEYDKMVSLTGWASQNDEIDYSLSHFIHADMTKDEMNQEQRSKGESTLGFKIADAFDSLTNPKASPFSGMMKVMTSALKKKDKEEMRMSFIESMGSGEVEELLCNSVLLEGRNDKCLSVFDKVVEERPELRRIGIFYGAAHLTDLHAKLEKRGYRLRAVEWIPAWRAAPRNASKTES